MVVAQQSSGDSQCDIVIHNGDVGVTSPPIHIYIYISEFVHMKSHYEAGVDLRCQKEGRGEETKEEGGKNNVL